MSDPFNLQRFIDAQASVFETALAEIRAGSKRSHWMWFIFPQLRGLGVSAMAALYSIDSLEEALLYVSHPLLGPRLHECVETILPWSGRRTAEQIFGHIDAIKLRSSLTLFDEAEPGGRCADGLEAFFAGKRDERTLALLNAGS